MKKLLLLLLLFGPLSIAAQSVAEQFLFSALNQERQSAGLAPLAWNAQLAVAAKRHALEMARRGNISHQFAGEADLTARAAATGASFSMVAENVGMSSEAQQMHDAWMASPGHRANILDARSTSVGIAVIFARGRLWAVQDFDRDVAAQTLESQEVAVQRLISQWTTVPIAASASARSTCGMQTGHAGSATPRFVMRYSTSDLSKLPEQLVPRLQQQNYGRVEVGACSVHDGGFSNFHLAVLLYP